MLADTPLLDLVRCIDCVFPGFIVFAFLFRLSRLFVQLAIEINQVNGGHHVSERDFLHKQDSLWELCDRLSGLPGPISPASRDWLITVVDAELKIVLNAALRMSPRI